MPFSKWRHSAVDQPLFTPSIVLSVLFDLQTCPVNVNTVSKFPLLKSTWNTNDYVCMKRKTLQGMKLIKPSLKPLVSSRWILVHEFISRSQNSLPARFWCYLCSRGKFGLRVKLNSNMHAHAIIQHVMYVKQADWHGHFNVIPKICTSI